jgi:hypothetical protein
VGYNQNHGQNSHRMYNPKMSRVVITRDIIWLGRMFYPQRDTKVTLQLPIVSVPISSVQASNETNNEVDTLEVTIQTPKEREGTHMDSSLEKTDGWTVHRTRSGCKVGRKDGQYDLSTGKTIMWSDVVVATEESSTKSMAQLNHYDVLGIGENEMQVIKSHNDALTKYVNIGAGIGGGFTNTQELKVMKYHEAINGPDGDAWKAEVKTNTAEWFTMKCLSLCL